MASQYTRIALLAGASVSAIGFGSAAQAAPVVHPGVAQIDTTAPYDDTYTLTICNIAPATPASPCRYGVDNSGTGLVRANVNSVPNGEIVQLVTGATHD